VASLKRKVIVGKIPEVIVQKSIMDMKTLALMAGVEGQHF
jgi:hypothetical protein